MKATAISFYHHAKVPSQMIDAVKKPRAIQILVHLLTLCNPNKPEVWVDQRLLGLKLGIHQDTAGIWIRYLEKIGRLAFLGYRHDGRRKRYRINLEGQENPSIPKRPRSQLTANPLKIGGQPPVMAADNHRSEERYINKEEGTKLKEQTVIDIQEKEFSSNEKIAVKQKLKNLGVFKQTIEKLLNKYSIEQIELQLKHIQYLTERGDRIEKPASWLLRAIEGNYSLPKEIDPNVVKQEQAQEVLRKASIIAQDAKFNLDEGKLETARELATKSLQLAKNRLANEILNEAEKLIERAEKIKEARAKISNEALLKMRQEEEQKELPKMRRWGKSDAEILGSTFFKNLINAVLDQRLLGAG